MNWPLACTGAFALLGWGAFFVAHGLLGVNRRRVVTARTGLVAARIDRDLCGQELAVAYARLARAEDEVMRLSGTLMARELDDSSRRRRAN